jgi:histidinol-phosphate aminotransferase
MSARPIEELIPAYIRSLQPYQPGRPIEEVERELKVIAVKLASNENPLGPSPRAIAAARDFLPSVHRYPDGSGYYLRRKLSQRLRVGMETLILGDGSCELIDLAARMMLGAGAEAITSEGSFPLYYIAVKATGARLVCVPLRDYTFDLDAIARAVTPKTRLIYLSNPNNPTGTMFTADALDSFLARIPEDILVVVDEAYYEYVARADYSRSLDLLRAGRNILVLRTFSKIYGLAGLRMGYGAGPEGLVANMNKVRAPFNTSSLAQVAALAALDDTAHVEASLQMNRAGLAQLGVGLEEMGLVPVPSLTNFVLVPLGRDANKLADDLLGLGVIVRPMGWMGFPEAIRVTVGTAAENEKFLAAMKQLCTGSAGGGVLGGSGENRQPARQGSSAKADPMREILESSRVIAVVGLSSSGMRPSYGVSQYMQLAGYRIIPVNPNLEEVLGEKAYARLEDVPEKIDIVDVFRRPEHVPEIVESAIRIGAKAVWMQEGVVHSAAAERARQAGLFVAMDSCILKDHRRYFPSVR